MKYVRWQAMTLATGLAAFALVAAGPASASTRAQPPPGRVTLSGSIAPVAARKHPVGVVAGSSLVSFDLVLKLRDPAGAAALVQAVSTPGGPSYRHYLTTAQWEARFSPGAAEVRAASGWLRSEGFRVGAVSADRITVAASGSAAQVDTAFATRLGKFRVNGHVVRLAMRHLSVPVQVAGSVAGTLGINQEVAKPEVTSSAANARTASSPEGTFPPPPPAFITPPPCGTYYGQKTKRISPRFGRGYPRTIPDEVCGYKPGQLRSGYHLNSGNTGKGITVAIMGAYGLSTIASDANRYFRQNDPSLPFASADFSQDDTLPFNNQSLCGAPDWGLEQALDVEAVHSMAPDAHILYVGAQNCIDGLFTAEQNVIDNKLANVITNSWGDIDGDVFDPLTERTAYDDIFMLADATGISVMFSSGDSGDDFFWGGISAAEYPAESPYVTAVGGTAVQIGARGQQTGQLGWADGDSYKCNKVLHGVIPSFCPKKKLGKWLPVYEPGGSGGYTSYNYAQPAYQSNVVPNSLALRNEFFIGPSLQRVEPDISMDADPSTGMLIGLHEVFRSGRVAYGQYRIGGTSLASPLLAGVIADADQAAAAARLGDVGFINPAIYALHANPKAIDDIRPGGRQALYRVDDAFSIFGAGRGRIINFWELVYEGPSTYCDETNNCVTRRNTLSTARGYDSMTGLGSIGPDFISDLAG